MQRQTLTTRVRDSAPVAAAANRKPQRLFESLTRRVYINYQESKATFSRRDAENLTFEPETGVSLRAEHLHTSRDL